jgi:hypothetical protein
MLVVADVFAGLSNFAVILDIVIGIPTIIIAIYGTVQVWHLRRTYRHRLQALAHQSTRRPVALAVGIGGDIGGDVRAYLKDQQHEMEVFSIVRAGFVELEEWPNVLDEFLALKNRLSAEVGPTEIHCFYKGPVVLATALGAILGNWVPTTLYALDKTYAPVLYLDKHLAVGKPGDKGK